jgi:hypothetical protein
MEWCRSRLPRLFQTWGTIEFLMRIERHYVRLAFVVPVFSHRKESLHGVHGGGCAIQRRLWNIVYIGSIWKEGPNYKYGFGFRQGAYINSLK